VNPNVEQARDRLEEVLPAHEVTAGLLVRVHGQHLTLVREEVGRDGEPEDDPRVRLTHLGGKDFGLSVLRHTGKWERTPFAGTVDGLVEVVCGPMQHIVAEWP
jgi:hypothetical protein